MPTPRWGSTPFGERPTRTAGPRGQALVSSAVLVAGGTGALGGAVVAELLAAGRPVTDHISAQGVHLMNVDAIAVLGASEAQALAGAPVSPATPRSATDRGTAP